jgi:nanoRNase/pAp phosphatase (c-di-AMP/oligoRNAs hydrolase)
MSLEPKQQFKEFLEKSKNILIIIPENPSGDAVGSAWALYYFLEKINKIPSIAFSNNLSPKFNFLPKPSRVTTEISSARDFVLSFDTTRNKIKNVRCEEKEGVYEIFITPEKGSVDPRDFSFIPAQFKYDLVVVLDSPDLEKLGKTYENNADLFFEVPVINIDWRSENENFGKVNLISPVSSSCTEIVFYFIKENSPEILDEKIAQCLLAGIVSATDSFQKKNATPKSFLTAALLMDKGANQQEIIRWLYRTQPLNILKLWGRVMAKIKWDEELKLAWSEITVEDFIQSRTTPENLPIILEKLQENFSEGKYFMVIYNDTVSSSAVVIKTKPEELLRIQAVLEGEKKSGIVEAKFPSNDLEETAEKIRNKLKN